MSSLFKRTTHHLGVLTALFLGERGVNAGDPNNVTDPALEEPGGDIIDSEVIDVVGRATDTQPGFRSVIDLQEAARETTSMADVLSQVVGVNVRSLGGLGSFTSVSIRGAAPSQTAVFIDGVPISKLGISAQDFSVFDLGSFSQLAIYRGAVPMELGGNAMGGAVDLHTLGNNRQKQRSKRFAVGLGSLRTRHILGSIEDHNNNRSYRIGLGYRGTNGDFRYFNDNGTFLRGDDDFLASRKNNNFDLVHGAARGRYRWPRVSVEAGSRVSVKKQGVPGQSSVQSEESSLSSVHTLVDTALEYRIPGTNTRIRTKSYVLLTQQSYKDIEGEVGLGNQHNRYRTLSTGFSGQLRHLVTPRHLLSAISEGDIERFSSQDFLDTSVESPRTQRTHWGAAVSDEFAVSSQFLLSPTVRFDYQYTNPGSAWSPIVANPDQLAPRNELFLSPRITSRFFFRTTTFKASIGRYFRAPTATELFGDRGFMVGNPILEAETGLSADLGVVVSHEKIGESISDFGVQAAGFVSQQKSAIVLLPSSGGAALAQNLGEAILFGVESSLKCTAGNQVQLLANYTFVDSRQRKTLRSYENKRLPSRPRHQAYTRVTISPQWARDLSLWSDLSYTSGNFLDAANTSQVPRRLFVGGGLAVPITHNISVSVIAKNIGNRRSESVHLDPPPREDITQVPRAVSDFLGYPLPGRSLYASINSQL